MHAPISPREEVHHHLVLLSPSVPCCNPRKTGKRNSGELLYFSGEDENELGCRHTHLRRLSREFPANPRRVGRRARYQSLRLVDFRRPPRFSRQFTAKLRRVRRRVRT
ncbi:uncharacterized protein LOC126601973 isoform X2 [Malus sylvestris]|uniref:uncharacterized protein LOC126601973 isoform X2 n=1 Tax=Malus sylvestris TaxID=3752 RepID=UPI0021AC1253|nr:uncharacterized protein LOC126601973 isoform X2 [Malus sylvestris]